MYFSSSLLSSAEECVAAVAVQTVFREPLPARFLVKLQPAQAFIETCIDHLYTCTCLLLVLINPYAWPHAGKKLWKTWNQLKTDDTPGKSSQKQVARSSATSDTLSKLPVELHLHILLCLDVPSVACLGQTSRYWNTVCTSSELWQRKCMRDYSNFALFPTHDSPHVSWRSQYVAARHVMLHSKSGYGISRPLSMYTQRYNQHHSKHAAAKSSAAYFPANPTSLAGTIQASGARSLHLFHHVPLTPLKAIGRCHVDCLLINALEKGYVMALPVRGVLKASLGGKTTPTRMLSCVHLVCIDLLTLPPRVRDGGVWKMHVQAVATGIAAVCAGLELASRGTTGMHRAVSRVLARGGDMGVAVGVVRVLALGVLVYIDAHLSVLPWIMLCWAGGVTWWAVLLGQVFWIPVVSAAVQGLNGYIGEIRVLDRVFGGIERMVWVGWHIVCALFCPFSRRRP